MALATPAMAAESPTQTGNGWVDYCQSPTGSWKWVACSWYARGLADTFILWRSVSPETAVVCIDPKIQGHQLVDVGLAYIKENPKNTS